MRLIAYGERGEIHLQYLRIVSLFSDEAFNHLVKVFSDCREFSGRVDLVICNICGAAQKKLTDASWNEICSMYRDYSAYSLSKGLEQKVFDVSEYGAARSDQILSHLGDWFGKVLVDARLTLVAVMDRYFRAYLNIFRDGIYTDLKSQKEILIQLLFRLLDR